MTNEITKTRQSNPIADKVWITSDNLKMQISQALPKQCSAERFMRVLFTQVQKVPKLMRCTKDSLFSAFITCGQLGIEPDGRRAHLIPYGDTCQLIIDYKGLAELALRSGIVSYLHADIVCENDEFDYNKGQLVTHRIDFKKDRGNPYAAYALCRFKDGSEKTEVMTMEDIQKIRKRSKAGQSGPWVTDFNEMAKKTVFRRMTKWLPLSPELLDATDKDFDQVEVENARKGPSVKPQGLFNDTIEVTESTIIEEDDGEADFVEVVKPVSKVVEEVQAPAAATKQKEVKKQKHETILETLKQAGVPENYAIESCISKKWVTGRPKSFNELDDACCSKILFGVFSIIDQYRSDLRQASSNTPSDDQQF